MKAHAAAIAEKLQGAHEARQQREQHGGEDEDMSKDEDRSVWSPEKREVVDTLAESVYDALLKLAEKNAPGEPQSNAVSAERVVELERELASARHAAEHGSVYWNCDRCNTDRHTCPGCGESLNHWRAVCDKCRERADAEDDAQQIHALEQLLATAYVVREVPWPDVAAGMMTISAQGEAWMVETWIGIGAVRLRNGERSFEKAIDASKGKTVRVLTPYVTPEAAEKLVRDELGATEGEP